MFGCIDLRSARSARSVKLAQPRSTLSCRCDANFRRCARRGSPILLMLGVSFDGRRCAIYLFKLAPRASTQSSPHRRLPGASMKLAKASRLSLGGLDPGPLLLTCCNARVPSRRGTVFSRRGIFPVSARVPHRWAGFTEVSAAKRARRVQHQVVQVDYYTMMSTSSSQTFTESFSAGSI